MRNTMNIKGRMLELVLSMTLVGMTVPGAVQAQRTRGEDTVSPARRIERRTNPTNPAGRTPEAPPAAGARTIDGSGNNAADPTMGAATTPLLRLVPAAYADGVSELAGAERPGPRVVSNTVSAQSALQPNGLRASDYLWQWGQFVDHDIDLTDGADPPESAAIAIPIGDVFFDPGATGTQVMAFNRSIYDPTSGSGTDDPRQQLNEITAWIDASNVYGSDQERADALRTNDGTGRLRMSAGDLLPFNTDGLPNAGGASATLFLAGDVRANEQVALTALHTLFVREHNRLVADLARANPALTGGELYQKARQLVGAEMQVITYREYLPALLGRRALRPYRGYRPQVDARIANLFSTAAYRYGHSALSPELRRVDASGNEIAAGHLALRDGFFAPQRLTDEGGIEPLLRGLSGQACQAVDPYVIDDIRNFLFGPPGAGGFDLASLNIQRGRDHGLPSYNDARASLGFARVLSFAEISSDPEIQGRLATAYGEVDLVDLWVGGLAEDPVEGAHVGELFHSVIANQFEALRDGDRYWYERTLSPRERRRVEGLRLADIIRRNTDIGGEIQDDVFHVR